MMQGKNKTGKLSVTQLRIRNVYGIQELEITPGNVNVIEGKNGQGKTSTMNSLMAAVGGGNLAEMRNIKTDEKPEIVIHIEGEENYIVKKTMAGTSVKRQVGDSEAYEDVSSPQALLNQMFDGKMSNPIKFMDAAPKDRVDLMLQAIELPYSFDDLCQRTQMEPEEFAPIPGKIHPMVEIDMHRTHVFNTRTGVNRDQKQKAASADQMFRSVPAETPEAEEIDEAREEIEALMIAQSGLESESKAELDAEIDRIETKLDGMEKEIRANLNLKKSKITSSAQEKIAAIQEKARADIDNIERDSRADLDIVKDAASDDIEHRRILAYKSTKAAREKAATAAKQAQDMQPEIDMLRTQISKMEERKEQAIKIETIKVQARAFNDESEKLLADSKRLTAALDAIDIYKAQMCQNLPVKGLEISGKSITVDGIKWDHLNTAKQIEIAVAVAALRSQKQKLPIMFVDGAERLDSESLELLKSEIMKHGVQGWIAKVADTHLKVSN